MRYLIFTILILNLAACCSDNGDCYIVDSPVIQLVYDEDFSSNEIGNSFVVVINNDSQEIVDTIRPFRSTISLVAEDEFGKNREMRDYSYKIQIADISETINNIQYQVGEEIRPCKTPCFPRERFDVTLRAYYNFSYEYKGERTNDIFVNIEK